MVISRRKSRLANTVQRALIVRFVAGTPARTAAQLVGLNRHTATLYYRKLREIIASHLALETPFFGGSIEVNESYFGGVRKVKRGRGAAGKSLAFGLLKRAGKAHTAMPMNCTSKTLIGLIREHVQPDSVVYTDSYKAYHELDVSEFQHHRINHRKRFAKRHNHINGIENFWNQAKRHLRRYNGVPREHFHLYLKECEWRFNYRPASRLLATWCHWVGLKD